MSSDFLKRLDPRLLYREVEDWWFDTMRGVRTAGNEHSPPPAKAVGEIQDSYIYGPVRVPNAHAALRALPVKHFSDYTFIDIGSGKGRMLFIAAEYPFRRVIGVEFAVELHQLACKNIARYRHPKRRSGSIESLNENAADFEFPSGKLIVYFFNPFGPKIMRRMLDNLERSLEREPRHVVLLMLWPEHSDVVAQRPWLKEISRTRRYHAFETFEPGRNGLQ
jgi:SAM-dependent methyltransferase